MCVPPCSTHSCCGCPACAPTSQTDVAHLSRSVPLQNVSANIVSTFQAGAFGGALFCFPLMESVGRRLALIVSTVIFLIGAILQTVATDQLSYIYAGRALVCVSSACLPRSRPPPR